MCWCFKQELNYTCIGSIYHQIREIGEGVCKENKITCFPALSWKNSVAPSALCVLFHRKAEEGPDMAVHRHNGMDLSSWSFGTQPSRKRLDLGQVAYMFLTADCKEEYPEMTKAIKTDLKGYPFVGISAGILLLPCYKSRKTSRLSCRRKAKILEGLCTKNWD